MGGNVTSIGRSVGKVQVLNRQKAILFMLQTADRLVSRIELVKWSFLVSHETPSGGGSSFYEFLPYHMGPFSFCLYREADKLAGKGLLREAGNSGWEITDQAPSAINGLPVAVRDDVFRVVERFKRASRKRLRGYIYSKYPWFTINSKAERRLSRPVAEPAIYTAGHQGQHVDGFLNNLLRAGLKQVIDVRHNPISRQYGFHKSTFSKLCERVGLRYEHMPALGIPSALRRSDRFACRNELFRYYKEKILPPCRHSIPELAGTMSTTPAVLICMESDPNDCHRSRLANTVAEAAGLPVRHLRRGECATDTSRPKS